LVARAIQTCPIPANNDKRERPLNMKYIFLIVLVILGFFGLYKYANTYTINVHTKAPETVEEWIDYYAVQYGSDASDLKKVAWCESGYRINAIGDGGSSLGVFQIKEQTFYYWTKQMGEDLDYENFQNQIKVASWAFSQGESYKNHWTCYKKVL
jgi:hypothetical protein